MVRAGDFGLAQGGVYFEFANCFVPFMTGGDPYSLARGFMEDNAGAMIGYLTAHASCHFALIQVAEAACEGARSASRPEMRLLEALKQGKLSPFKVTIRHPTSQRRSQHV